MGIDNRDMSWDDDDWDADDLEIPDPEAQKKPEPKGDWEDDDDEEEAPQHVVPEKKPENQTKKKPLKKKATVAIKKPEGPAKSEAEKAEDMQRLVEEGDY